MENHWQPDEFTQSEGDYSGGGAINSPRKRSGKRSKEAQAAKMRRYRARHRSQSRAYMRRYMAARRSASRAGTDPAAHGT